MQFGTSRFLQAHVDLFVSEALDLGQAVGPITVVKSTAGTERAARLAGLVQTGGFPVIIRGIEDGRRIDRHHRVHSVHRALSAAADWPEVKRIFVDEVTHLVSNTGDRGYAVPDIERDHSSESSTHFTSRLLELLAARYGERARPLTVLPCELVSRNGHVLRDAIIGLAQSRGHANAFIEWMVTDVVWACSVVDRIVSEALEPAGAIAEPYALWAVESQPGLTLPCQHPSIQVVESLEAVERLKLHVLNLGHTLLAHWWLHNREPRDQTVRGVLGDDTVRSSLESVYRDEVLPGFAARGLKGEAEQYICTTRDRFDNPYLDHHLRDIATNHVAKVERRITAFIDWARAAGDASTKPVLQRVCDEIAG